MNEIENQPPEEVSKENNPTLGKRIKNWNPNVALGLKITAAVGACGIGLIGGGIYGVITSPVAFWKGGKKSLDYLQRRFGSCSGGDGEVIIIILAVFLIRGATDAVINPFIHSYKGGVKGFKYVYDKNYKNRNKERVTSMLE